MSLSRSVFFGIFFISSLVQARPDKDRNIDLNKDGRADVCHRVSKGILCWLGTGNYQYSAPRLWTTDFNDAATWNKAYYGKTVQFADVNGDGRDDVCGRAGHGIVCELSNGTSFDRPATTWTTEFSNTDGWAEEPYYETIEIRDLDHDGKADIQGFGPNGYVRLRSNGSEFVPF